ncbi:MAG: hypothetical protein ABI777_08535 [Betaproteobacteria bacterium]
MEDIKHLEIAGGVGRYYPKGRVSLVDAVQMVTHAIAYCRSQDIHRLLVDVRQLYGFSTPTTADRFWMVHDWAQASAGLVAMAMVALPEHIDPAKFGVKVAADIGLKGDVFTSEVLAMEWLILCDPNASG